MRSNITYSDIELLLTTLNIPSPSNGESPEAWVPKIYNAILYLAVKARTLPESELSKMGEIT